jgi:hypothetical protein
LPSWRMTASGPWRPTGLTQEPCDHHAPPHRRFVPGGTRCKISRAVSLLLLVTMVVGRELGTDCPRTWTGSLAGPSAHKAIAERVAMAKQTSVRTVSISASPRTRRYVAGQTMGEIKAETGCLLCR